MSNNDQYPQEPQQPGQQVPGQPPYGYAPQQQLPGASYPGAQYTGPGYAPQPAPPGGGLAISALVVGIVAFLAGWAPIFGFVIAVVGIVLGILVVRKPYRKGFGWAAIGLSAIAAITSIITTVVFVIVPLTFINATGGDGPIAVPAPTQETDDPSAGSDEAEYSVVSGQRIETPCWSYDGPKNFVNNIGDAEVASCIGTLELWGEWQDDDIFEPTGVGVIAGQIQVDPQLTSAVEAAVPGSDVNAFLDLIEEQKQYFSQQGEIISLHEEATIGGVPANITRLDSTAPETQTKAFITVLAPKAYDTPDGQVQMFLISVTTPYSNGDEQIEQLLDTWEWK